MTADTAERYNAREAETRWQTRWDDAGIFATSNSVLARTGADAPPTCRCRGRRMVFRWP